ncbi:MAG: AmmeMemoRadiSam system protein B [Acidobacteriota bacterium]
MDWLTAPCIAILAATPVLRVRAGKGPKIRQPAVAGSFYPAEPDRLTQMIDALVAKASPPKIEGAVVAAVAPHAGYLYSGPVAAFTYAALRGRKYARAIVIAPSHYAKFGFASVYDGEAYATPLGTIPVDREFARKLAGMSPAFQLSDQGHAPTAGGGEHAIEVQLPWLQRVLDGSFALVPIVMGDHRYEASRALGAALAKLVRAEPGSGDTLVLASSDLSHYHPCAEAESIDRKTLRAIESWDYFSMARNFEARVWEACGGAPIVAAMVYAERMGANRAQVLEYENSGAASGDRAQVVGYGAEVFVRSPQAGSTEAPFTLSPEEESELLGIARHSVEHMVRKREIYTPPAPAGETLQREYGAFVTLLEKGILRGCIGYTSAVKPLYITVRDTATLAALRDPRFSAVTAAELPDLSYEISVLSPLRHVSDLEQIEVGRDGLLVRNGHHEGLLLPQVPVEQHWDRARFVEETCRKANIQAGGWQQEDTDIFRFTAVVFGDAEAEKRRKA